MTGSSRSPHAHEAKSIHGGIGGAFERNQIDVEQSAVCALDAERAHLHQSAAVAVHADRVSLDQSAAVAVVGRDVAARNVTTVFLLSPRVSGTVRTVFDMRAAFAFGLGIVLGRRLLRLLRMN